LSTSYPPTNQGRPTVMADRLQSLNDKVNKPMACDTCGGTFFIKQYAERFSNNGYNSAQIKSISPNQQPVFICLCGEPVVIKDTSAGQRADGDRQQLLVSLGLAAAHRKETRVSTIADKLATVTEQKIDRQTIAEMQTQMNYLDEAVAQLLASSDIEVETETETETEGADEPEVLEAGTEGAQGTDAVAEVAGVLDTELVALPVVVAKAAQNPRTGRRPVATRTA
jgi:hypothetical protein